MSDADTDPAREAGEVHIESESDIVTARRTARQVASDLGFGVTDTTRIVTATSELARNIYLYAGSGVMRWRTIEERGKTILEFDFEDEVPGIENVEQAMEAGYTTSDGMGRGLSGTDRLMDDMEIDTVVGEGTTITIRKYLS